MDTFSIHFHYGGMFVDKKKLKFVGGDDTLVEAIDVDKVSFFRIVDLTEEAGADLWKALYYVEPPLGLRKKRTRDFDEPQGQTKLSKMRKVIKCSKCQGLNHNARTCKGVTMEASASTSRGRSTLFGFSSACIETQESSVQPSIPRG